MLEPEERMNLYPDQSKVEGISRSGCSARSISGVTERPTTNSTG